MYRAPIDILSRLEVFLLQKGRKHGEAGDRLIRKARLPEPRQRVEGVKALRE
ncbi:MAG: hypothetical protein LBF50_03790 [Azoarcus sp.]|nr:hypothetical protein [Azoarcus sp.]